MSSTHFHTTTTTTTTVRYDYAICEMPPAWLIWTAVGIIVPSVAIQLQKDRLNLFLMGVFRDIGRHKAHKRRFGDNSMALRAVLMHKEDDIFLGVADEEPDIDHQEYTLDELWEFGSGHMSQDGQGSDEASPLLLSIFGRVYDVTQGQKFYGPTSAYHMFAGHDVTYALSTGCKTDYCLEDADAADLTEAQLTEGKRWLSFFQLHDKYPFVGKLVDAVITDSKMNEWIEEAMEKQQVEDGETPKAPILY